MPTSRCDPRSIPRYVADARIVLDRERKRRYRCRDVRQLDVEDCIGRRRPAHVGRMTVTGFRPVVGCTRVVGRVRLVSAPSLLTVTVKTSHCCRSNTGQRLRPGLAGLQGGNRVDGARALVLKLSFVATAVDVADVPDTVGYVVGAGTTSSWIVVPLDGIPAVSSVESTGMRSGFVMLAWWVT